MRNTHQVHKWNTGSFRIVVDESKWVSGPFAQLECSSGNMEMLTPSCLEALAKMLLEVAPWLEEARKERRQLECDGSTSDAIRITDG